MAFVFSGIESGVLSVSRVRLRHHARRGFLPAKQLDRLLGDVERLILTVVIVTSAASFLAVYLFFREISRLAGPGWATAAVLACAPVYLLLTDFLPKAIFRRFPYRFLVQLTKLLGIVYVLLCPVVSGATRLARFLFGGRYLAQRREIRNVEDVKHVLQSQAAAASLTRREQDFINSVMNFRHMQLQDFLVPMEQVVCVAPETPIEECVELSRRTDFDRLPVRAPDGSIAGILKIFHVLMENPHGGRAQSYMRRMITARQDEDCFQVLQRLRAGRQTLALVMDANEKPLGIVAAEDLIRALLTGRIASSPGR